MNIRNRLRQLIFESEGDFGYHAGNLKQKAEKLSDRGFIIGKTGQMGTGHYFYGNLETDISATIYEMRYLINLGRNQFTNTSNPTWTSGTTSYVTEIALYDSNYDLIVISKLQSPELRQGIQQYVVKLDF